MVTPDAPGQLLAACQQLPETFSNLALAVPRWSVAVEGPGSGFLMDVCLACVPTHHCPDILRDRVSCLCSLSARFPLEGCGGNGWPCLVSWVRTVTSACGLRCSAPRRLQAPPTPLPELLVIGHVPLESLGVRSPCRRSRSPCFLFCFFVF